MRLTTPLSLLGLALSVGAAPMPGSAGALHAQVAVIVGAESPLTRVSLDELRAMYLGKTTRLQNGDRVILLESPQARGPFYQTALRMSPERVKRHWIGVVFSGAGALPPREIASAEELQDYLNRHPGAIAFLEARAVKPSVKVLAVDGHKPGDADYPIR